MQFLSNAFAKGRTNTAGCTKLAVFFLVCLCFFCGCPSNAAGSDSSVLPYVTGGRLYSYNPDSDQPDCITQYDFFNMTDGFIQNATAVSKKKGYILAWNQKKQRLYHITEKKLVSSTELKASLVYAGANYILAQSSSFSDNKGFSFTLYTIKYSLNGRKIKLKTVWNGYADCFVSDFFFTRDGICIAGGTRDDSKNNAFYITSNGIHKCFSVAKKSDFLRLVPTGESQKVYAFISTRDKSARTPVIYSFNMSDVPDKAVTINLSGDSLLPADFESFFGYGFSAVLVVPELIEGPSARIILPASINGIIQFICYDSATGKITGVVPDAVGCMTPLASIVDGTYYIARDPLIEDSWYGIALFTGSECKKIAKFF